MKRTLRAQSDFKKTLLRNQLTSLILFESVTTTKAKAKQLIPFADRFFNRIKSADLNAKRLANEVLFDKNAVSKSFEEILPRYNEAEVTFVRSFRLLSRKGDRAEMMMVGLIKPLQVKKESKESTKETTEKVTSPKSSKASKGDK